MKRCYCLVNLIGSKENKAIMSQSIFVLETPEACIECIFGEAGTYGGIYCKVLHRFCKCKPYSKDKDCPLRELPGRRRYGEEFFNGNAKGWNDCLKTILGENKKDFS